MSGVEAEQDAKGGGDFAGGGDRGRLRAGSARGASSRVGGSGGYHEPTGPADGGGYSFLRTDCRADWRKTTRGEGVNRPKLDMVFGDDFAELVGAGATRVGGDASTD